MNKITLLLITLFFISCEREHRFYFVSGELQNHFTTINGKMDGESITYFKNGKIRIIKRYENGKLCGSSELYNEKGELEAKSEYDNGILIINETFNKKGELIVKATILKQEMYYRYNNFFQITFTSKDSVSQEHYNLDSCLLYSKQDSAVIYKYYAPNKSDLGLFTNLISGDQDSIEFYKFRKFVKNLDSK